MWLDSAMIGPAAMRATAEGRRATNGARRARKVRNSSATMNSTESTSVRVWVRPFWFCSSTERASDPVRCMPRPGADDPAVVKIDRRSATTPALSRPLAVGGTAASTSALRARPLAETPSSTTAATVGSERMACSVRSMAWLSALVSVPEPTAAT